MPNPVLWIMQSGECFKVKWSTNTGCGWGLHLHEKAAFQTASIYASTSGVAPPGCSVKEGSVHVKQRLKRSDSSVDWWLNGCKTSWHFLFPVKLEEGSWVCVSWWTADGAGSPELRDSARPETFLRPEQLLWERLLISTTTIINTLFVVFCWFFYACHIQPLFFKILFKLTDFSSKETSKNKRSLSLTLKRTHLSEPKNC